MAKYKDADAWLEWAQRKYAEAQERFAWMERPRSDTMDSWQTLVDLIEDGMAHQRERKAPAVKDKLPLEMLAEQMETLGIGGFAYKPSDMVEAAKTIRRALDGQHVEPSRWGEHRPDRRALPGTRLLFRLRAPYGRLLRLWNLRIEVRGGLRRAAEEGTDGCMGSSQVGDGVGDGQLCR